MGAGDKASAGLSVGAQAGAATAAIGTAAAAANAVPIAGQVVSAGLGLAALFTKIFAGRRKRRRRQAMQRRLNAAQQQMTYNNQFGGPQDGQALGMMGYQGNIQQTPPTQGYGMFQQMQEGPIYSAGGTNG